MLRLRAARSACGGGPAGEPLMNFAVAGTFCKTAPAISREHAPPEQHSARIALILDDLPVAGEAVENQGGGIAADADPAILLAHEELRHGVVNGGGLTGSGDARAGDQSEAHGI